MDEKLNKALDIAKELGWSYRFESVADVIKELGWNGSNYECSDMHIIELHGRYYTFGLCCDNNPTYNSFMKGLEREAQWFVRNEQNSNEDSNAAKSVEELKNAIESRIGSRIIEDDVRGQLVEKFLEAMDHSVDWNRRFVRTFHPTDWKQRFATTQHPVDGVYNAKYSGINRFILGEYITAKGYKDPRFFTQSYIDAQNRERRWFSSTKIKVMNGEKPIYIEDSMGQPIAVYNAMQLTGIEKCKEIPQLTNADIRKYIDAAARNMGVAIEQRSSFVVPHYIPEEDKMRLPLEENFGSESGYLCEKIQELCRAVGHSSRLDNGVYWKAGQEDDYALEELKIEIATCFVSGDLGLDVTKLQYFEYYVHEANMQNYYKQIEKSPGKLIEAICEAQSIADYVLEKTGYIKDIEIGRLERLEEEITCKTKISKRRKSR